MSRKPVVIGNWKMELTHKAALALAKSLTSLAQGSQLSVEAVICPSFPSLEAIGGLLKGSVFEVGAQQVHYEERGAFTGEVAAAQLNGLVSWCLVGHSEHRALSRENDEQVYRASELLLRYGITPVVCFGESAAERDAGDRVAVVKRQLGPWLAGTNRVAAIKTVLAYEPVWAIGSGEMPDPNDVAEVLLVVRKMMAAKFDAEAANRVRILYGGSVTPETVAQYVGGPEADGVLVGGASLHPRQFLDIIAKVQAA